MIKRILLAGLFALGITSVAHAAPLQINLCTGGNGGIYYTAGNYIKDATSGSSTIELHVEESKGSIDNVRRTVDVDPTDPSACEAFIGQPDAVVYAKRKNPSLPIKQIAQLHREYLQVLCNKDSGVTDLSSLPGGKDASGMPYSVNIGPEGSGAWAVWQNFVHEKDAYKDVPTKNEIDKIALGSVASGDTTCMVVAAGLPNPTIQEANDSYSDQVVLAEASDWSFNNALDIRGKPLYEFVKMPRTYTNLQGWMGGKRETISWLAGVYVNPQRMGDDKALGDFITYANRAKANIVAAFGK
jgi:TRAP-type uncharacterized transport system substrate-binding protein